MTVETVCCDGVSDVDSSRRISSKAGGGVEDEDDTDWMLRDDSALSPARSGRKDTDSIVQLVAHILQESTLKTVLKTHAQKQRNRNE